MAAKAPVEVFSATFADRALGLRMCRVSDSQKLVKIVFIATPKKNQKDAEARFYKKHGGLIYVSMILPGKVYLFT